MASLNSSTNFSFKKKLLDFASNSTLHGISNIISSKHFLIKIGWLMGWLISLGYCMFFVTSNLIEYQSFPLVTNYETIFEKSPLFPKISISGSNRSNERAYFNSIPYKLYHTLDDQSLFNHGFNNETIHRSMQTGPVNGLILELYPYNAYNGIELGISNQSESYTEGTIKVSPGTEASFAIKRVSIERLGPPYSDCRHYEVLNNNTDKYLYAKKSCYIKCKKRMIAERCDCSPKFEDYSDYFNTDIKTFDFFYREMISKCSKRNATIIMEIEKSFRNIGEIELCLPYCPNECSSIEYTVTPYFFRLTENEYKRGYTKIRVYYESFDYTLVKQIPKMTSDSLIGTVGGLFGLFLGASLLSYLEIIELFFSLMHVLISKCFVRKPVKNKKITVGVTSD